MEAKAKNAATADKKEVTVKPEVREFANIIKKESKIHEGGAGTASAETYEKLLVAGNMTKEAIKSVRDFDTIVAAAGLLATGELGIEHMKKNKGVDRVTMEIGVGGRDSFEFSIDREKQVNTGLGGGDGEKKTTFGAARVNFNIYGVGNRGEIKKVKQILAEQALAAFGS